MESKRNITVNFGGLSILTILFIVLKLTNYIDWSWWWVFSPLWIGWIIVIMALLLILLLSATRIYLNTK